MHKIVVLNSKGGSGKSTLATNLASYFAVQNRKPTLLDLDPQGSSMRWIGKRADHLPTVYGVAGYERKAGVTRSFALRSQSDSEVTIVDTPAAVESHRLPELIRDAQHILVPVLPSDIDIHAATRCIANLLLIAKVNRNAQRIAVIANRVKRNTLMYQTLMKFLQSLQIPVVATLRDAQVYVRAFEAGVGLFELKNNTVSEDLEQWQPLLGWLQNQAPGAIATKPNLPNPTIMQQTPAMPAVTNITSTPTATSNDSSAQPPVMPTQKAVSDLQIPPLLLKP